MGMYDTVNVPCPDCGTKQGFQSKSGPCLLDTYELDKCPMDVLRDVNRHAPATCEKCGIKYCVMLQIIAEPTKWVEQDMDFLVKK